MYFIKMYLPNNGKIKPGDNDNFILSSELIFNAIVNSYIRLYGTNDLETFVDRIKISSSFPGIEKKEKELLLFPRPKVSFSIKTKNSNNVSLEEEIKKRKRLKKIKFFTKKRLDEFLETYKGRGRYEIDLDYIDNGIYFSEDEKELCGVFKPEEYIEPKNIINRVTGTTEQFFYNKLWEITWKNKKNRDYRAFYFFYWDGDLTDQDKAVIRLMADEGIGGDRSTGKGFFEEVSFEKMDNAKLSGNIFYLISLALPKKGELGNNDCIGYDFKEKSGMIYYGYPVSTRKPVYRKFVEGSVFEKEFEGELKKRNENGKTTYNYSKALFLK